MTRPTWPVIAEHGITVHFVPSMLRAFVEVVETSADEPPPRVIAAARRFPPSWRRAFSALPPAELHNLYGPTEAAIDVSRWR